MLFGSGIVVRAGVEAGWMVHSEAGLIGIQRCGDAVILLICTSVSLDFYHSVPQRCGDTWH